MDKDKFITTKVSKSDDSANYSFNDGVVAYVKNQIEYFQRCRLEKEDVWLECWAMYYANPRADQEIKKRISRTVGDVTTDWRHRVSTGKAFEQVETILAHMQAAFFPNRDWFDAIPCSPGYADLAKLIKKYTAKKLHDASFITYWEMFMRQLLITGNSVMALPWLVDTMKWKRKVKIEHPVYKQGMLEVGKDIEWKVEEQERVVTNRPDFQVLDMFDCFFDPNALDINHSDFARRIIKSKAEVADLIRSKYYKNLSVYDVVATKPYWGGDFLMSSVKKQTLKTFEGMTIDGGYSWNDQVEIIEYWGDVTVQGETFRDITATLINDTLVRFETNPYWCGKPFIYGSYIPLVRSTMAMGVIEPSLGLLHEMNILTNQRLDNLELSVNSMWEYVDDGTLAIEDIYSRPGRVFPVAQQGTLRPIAMPNQFVITYDEQSVLEERIDKNAGTGTAISANAARDAERVTAEEIRAARSAGGTRLSSLHKHIEETSLIPLLNKVFRLFQQFVSEDEIVRVSGEEPGDYDFFAVGVEELANDFILTPVGADHIADKDYEISQRLNFLQIVSQNPEMSQHINFYNFMLDLARRMGIDDVEQFIKKQEAQQGMGMSQQMPQEQQQAPAPLGGQPPQEFIGGQVDQYLKQNLAADGGANMMKETTGVDMDSVPPQIQAQLAQLAGQV